jgi:ubiquinone/menaquinone biosynthesis C-methylase UbiE
MISSLMKLYGRTLLVSMQRLTEERFLNLLSGCPHSTILDIGCGNGEFTLKVATRIGAETTVGIERVLPFAKMASSKAINVVLGDASHTLPFKEEMFDVVVANQVIEHVNNTDIFVKEIRRILKNNCYCVIATPNLAGLQNIISLMMGYQPPTAHVSDDLFASGNPLNPDRNIVVTHIAHRRIFTARALKELVEFHGLKCKAIRGFGLHPLPPFLSRLVNSPRYSPVIAIKARKIVSG